MRLPELTEDKMSAAQKAVFKKICAGPKGKLGPPTSVLIRSPLVAERVQPLSEYVRYESPNAGRIMEFAILIAARYWSCEYVWHAHYPLAIGGGLDEAVAADLARGKRPVGMKDDEAAVYAFCTELHKNKEVTDGAFNAVIKHFGEQGLVDLMACSAYYTLQSMTLKVNQTPVPEGAPRPLLPMKLDQMFAA
jgi:4-carboxymuconolactone decarboxylase